MANVQRTCNSDSVFILCPFISHFLMVSAFRHNVHDMNSQSFLPEEHQIHSRKVRIVETTVTWLSPFPPPQPNQATVTRLSPFPPPTAKPGHCGVDGPVTNNPSQFTTTISVWPSPHHSLAGFGAFSSSDVDISPYSVSSSSSTQISESYKLLL